MCFLNFLNQKTLNPGQTNFNFIFDLPDHLDVLDDSYEPVLSLFYACTMSEPEKRPTAKLIVENIEKLDREEEQSDKENKN